MINVGIIGSGFIVPVFIGCSRKCRDYHLRAIWGRHEEKLLQFKNDFDYCTTDLEAFLSDEKIDVVYVALPNALHYEYAMKALKHGKHVILEKPFTVFYKDAKKLIDLRSGDARRSTVSASLIATREIGFLRLLVQSTTTKSAIEFRTARSDLTLVSSKEG